MDKPVFDKGLILPDKLTCLSKTRVSNARGSPRGMLIPSPQGRDKIANAPPPGKQNRTEQSRHVYLESYTNIVHRLQLSKCPAVAWSRGGGGGGLNGQNGFRTTFERLSCHKDFTLTQAQTKVTLFYLNPSLQVEFRAIFEPFSYILLNGSKRKVILVYNFKYTLFL